MPSIGRSSHFFDNSDGLHEQAASFSFKPRPFARDRKVLTRAAKGDDINRLYLRAVDFSDIAQMFHVRKPLGRYGDRERLYLARPHGFYSAYLGGERESPRAIE
jgi:hypothetical protein